MSPSLSHEKLQWISSMTLFWIFALFYENLLVCSMLRITVIEQCPLDWDFMSEISLSKLFKSESENSRPFHGLSRENRPCEGWRNITDSVKIRTGFRFIHIRVTSFLFVFEIPRCRVSNQVLAYFMKCYKSARIKIEFFQKPSTSPWNRSKP